MSDTKLWLYQLPQDALHLTASFLSTEEWLAFGQTSSSSARIWRSVSQRVQLHGLRCAAEIAAAIRMGQLADAKELAALYVHSGVPCYPRSRGYGLHTLLWRIQVEVEGGSIEENDIDPFYFHDHTQEEDQQRIPNIDDDDEEDASTVALKTYLDQKVAVSKKTKSGGKASIEVHEHLFHDHLRAANPRTLKDPDERGKAPPFSLSADFFHQHGDKKSSNQTERLFSGCLVKTYNSGSGDTFDLRHLRERIKYYKKLAEKALKSSNSSIDECLLDFWDEVLPTTKSIHFFNGSTAVPRLSHLQDFLKTPCSPALGVIQCEIERVKTTSRRKGVKGRLFPVYDYVLFIRDGRIDDEEESARAAIDKSPSRKDVILMVAKSIRMKQRGSNNYIITLPSEADIRDHHNRVNPDNLPGETSAVDETAIEVGRLQSNFAGTDFQVFRQCTEEEARAAASRPKAGEKEVHASEDEVCDSGFSTDASGGQSRFSIFSLRNFTGMSGSNEPAAVRPARPRRGRVANFVEKEGSESKPEVEISAISYTASLLGSRPRIMDVCVPKVSDSGTISDNWQKVYEPAGDDSERSMLNCLKLIRERAREPEEARGEINEEEQPDFGLLSMQNRAPWWNNELGSFVLNFGGRVSVASVKNFQLCDPEDEDNVILQFGRIHGRHSFTMDYQHPLTALQAFAMAISSLQSKITLV